MDTGIKRELGFTKKEMLKSWLKGNPKGQEKRSLTNAASELARLHRGAMPACWLTTCPVFELSSFAIDCEGAPDNKAALVMMERKGLVGLIARIEVDVSNALLATSDNIRVSLKRGYDSLQSLEMHRYESAKWAFTVRDIPASSITRIDTFNGGQWMDCTEQYL